jgi:hypothetical protein
MPNDRRFIVKNGLQAQNIAYVSPNNSNTILATMLDSDVLSFSGNSGQLFSISDDMTGVIFAVNDISGVPSIEVDASGTIRLAETVGNVLIGTATDNGVDKLQIVGSMNASVSLKSPLLYQAAQAAPSTPSADTFVMYVTASGVSPNREVAYKVKNPAGEEIIVSSVLV